MSTKRIKQQIQEAYDSQRFRKTGYQVVDMLADYLEHLSDRKIDSILPNIAPGRMMDKWKGNFPKEPSSDFISLLQKVISESIHLHNPKYIGHQVTAPLPLAALSDFVGSLLNNAPAIYEMGPVGTVLEKRIIDWMAGLIGYDEKADGILTSGGTLGNLTALLAARQAKAGYDIWTNGIDKKVELCVLISEQSHYSVKRAVGVMGLGEGAVTLIPVDKNYRMDLKTLNEKYNDSIKTGEKVIAVVGNACTTATGSYDDLQKIADFCEERDLWFHVDGAHGASALLSDKYKDLLKGINRADSIVWDAHKMLLMPALITAVIFKEGSNSYETFSQKASYLFEKEAREEWYNLAHRTMECTKNMMGLKLYTSIMVYGTDFFADYVTLMNDIAKEFAAIIKNSKDFELAIEPQCNIICFRYLKQSVKDLDELQKNIRRKIIESEKFYITQTQLKDKFYLRCVITNPLTTINDLQELLNKIRVLR